MVDIKGLFVWTLDTSDPTDLSTKKDICFVPVNHLDHAPLDPGYEKDSYNYLDHLDHLFPIYFVSRSVLPILPEI